MSEIATVDDIINFLFSQSIINLIEYCSILFVIVIVADMCIRDVRDLQVNPYLNILLI